MCVRHFHGYYSPSDLYDKIMRGIAETGKDLSGIALDDLQSVEEFYIRSDVTIREPTKLSEFTPCINIPKPGWRVVLCGVCSNKNTPGYFSVPWARDSSMGFLVSPVSFCDFPVSAGFHAEVWSHRTDLAKMAFSPCPLIRITILMRNVSV